MDVRRLAGELGLEEFEFREVLKLFIESSAEDMADFNSAVRSGDSRRASAAIHSIKGAALNLGFHDISRAAVRIEHQTRQNNLEGLSKAAARLDKMIGEIACRIMK